MDIRNNRRVLVLDSAPDSFHIIEAALQKYGFEALGSRGSDIIGQIGKERPDFIIADYHYPAMTGIRLLDELKSRGEDIPVMLLGRASEKNLLDALRSGATDFIGRPFKKELLEERIEALSSKSREISRPDSEKDKAKEETEPDSRELMSLLDITSLLGLNKDTKQLLNQLAEITAKNMKCEAASILLKNERENLLEFVVATGEKKDRLETISIPLEEGIAGWVACNGDPQIVNDTSSDQRFTGSVDKESGFSTRKIAAVPLKIEEKIIGVLEVINPLDDRKFSSADIRLLGSMGKTAVEIIETTRTIEDHQNFYIQMTNILVKAIEKKDTFAEGHCWRVAEISHMIALEMNLKETEINDLYYGALLHDIGKLDIPSSVFNRRVITDRELNFIRKHPFKGAKLLEPVKFWKTVVPLVLCHHEAWNGSGYPYGRAGEDIPIGARIINISEAYSVMRSPKTYKRQLSIRETVLELMRLSGKQFDPSIIKILIGILEKESSRNRE